MDKNKDNYYRYDELKKIVKINNIRTKNEYIEKYKMLSNSTKKAPLNPYTFYGKEIWKNWSEFLSKPIYKKKINNIYYDYETCKKVIQDKKIESKSDFYKKIKELIIENNKIPYSPQTIYEDKWEGWGEFLGTGRVSDNQKLYKSFEDAKLWARSLNLKMVKEWRQLNLSELPKDIPKKPEKTYKDGGWIDYYDWLGIDKKEKISYGEKKIYDFLIKNDINFQYNKSITGCKNENNLRFDFILLDKSICIEFDGIQHFKPIDFFGGEDEYVKTKMRDEIKNIFCKLEGIKLIRIPYFLSVNEITNLLKKEVI
jgi:hypothetical protein